MLFDTSPETKSLQWYTTNVVSQSILADRYGEIILANEVTLAGAMAWSVRKALDEYHAEMGWGPEGPAAGEPVCIPE